MTVIEQLNDTQYLAKISAGYRVIVTTDENLEVGSEYDVIDNPIEDCNIHSVCQGIAVMVYGSYDPSAPESNERCKSTYLDYLAGYAEKEEVVEEFYA